MENYTKVYVTYGLDQLAEGLGHLAKSNEFKADFELNGFAWFYHATSGDRGLIVRLNKESKDASLDVRDAAKRAAKQLQAMKIKDATFEFMGSEIANLVGDFENSFVQWNHEICSKRQKTGAKADEDPRTVRVQSNVENYNLSCEGLDTSSKDYKLKLAAAKAMERARCLAETRASIATPSWMAASIRKDLPNIERVVTFVGKELEERGMNLFYNVGKGSNDPPRMVAYYYRGNKASNEVDLAIVGKGVTYDTGGLNIKTSMMDMMHGDKGGSCAVIGALE